MAVFGGSPLLRSRAASAAPYSWVIEAAHRCTLTLCGREKGLPLDAALQFGDWPWQRQNDVGAP